MLSTTLASAANDTVHWVGPGFGWWWLFIPVFWILFFVALFALLGRRWRRGGPWGDGDPRWAGGPGGSRSAGATLGVRGRARGGRGRRQPQRGGHARRAVRERRHGRGGVPRPPRGAPRQPRRPALALTPPTERTPRPRAHPVHRVRSASQGALGGMRSGGSA